MVFQIASLIFSIINIVLLFNAASKVKGNEQTLTEEYQNINLTNKIIEKLLQNYEILKSMYKSQDMLHSSSSFDANKAFKNSQGEKTTKHRNRSLKKIINYSRTSLRPGTAMIYGSASSSHEEVSTSVEKTKYEKNIIKNLNTKRVKFENILEYNKKQESKVSESKESKSNDEEVDELPVEIPTAKDAVDKLKQKVMNTKKPYNKKHKSKHNDLGEKTRFDILKQVSHKKQKHKSLRTDNDSNTRRIKKVVYSEKFSPFNIWYEVINKPIKLNIDIDPFSQKEKVYEKEDAVEQFSVYILNSSTKESHEERTESELRNIEIENLLRSTYGEACLRTPITKCKKVVKAVNKNVCKSRFKCKSDFKSDFVEFGDEGCEREFSFNQPNDKIKHDKKSSEEKVQPVARKRDEAISEEYLREENNFKELFEKNRHDIIIDKSALRDKYERECQKQSKSKCIKACNYGVEKTCSRHTCEDRKEKGLKKGCKTECKKMFQVEKDSDESGSSETESESESETASD